MTLTPPCSLLYRHSCSMSCSRRCHRIGIAPTLWQLLPARAEHPKPDHAAPRHPFVESTSLNYIT